MSNHDATASLAAPETLQSVPMQRESQAAAAIGPTVETGRIGSIDALRGFALLGILVLNIQSFAMPGMAYMIPTSYGDLTGGNWWVWYLSHVLGDQKFMSIFSMLFGAGIVLMTSREEARGAGSAGLHYRRMGWLILFGVLHAHLLWYGDILYFYGVCGLGVYLARRWRPGTLIVFGLALIAVPSVVMYLGSLTVPHWPPEAVDQFNAAMHPGPQIQAEIAAYQSGWLGQMGQRVVTALMFETIMLLFFGWRIAGLMLIGMALYKLNVFSARRSTWFYLAMVVAGTLTATPMILYGVKANFEHNWDGPFVFFTGMQFNYWGSNLMSLAYVGLVMLIWKSVVGAKVLQPLAAVGRLAFSNYLLQTLVCTWIFYGHGLGLFGEMERVGQIGVVAAVSAVQLIWSPLWLWRFRFGPAEWLWRTLSYGRFQPMRRFSRVAPLISES